ncbi:MAG: Nif3-like dinuclear metal center hexameric protein [Eubacteriaceae bacterium]
MSVKCQQIISIIEDIAPKKLAEEWDNVGLLIGTTYMNIERVLVCLDINEEVVNEAIEKKVNLIISHHPLLFSPIQNIRWDNYKGKLIKELITNEIGVYCAHTNLDISSNGLNYWLSEMFQLQDIQVLKKINEEKMYKFVVFVPKSEIDAIKTELAKQGAGWTGNYSHCSFSSLGIGSFKPLEGSQPYRGSVNKIENIDEYRLETIIKEKDLFKTIKAVIKKHPYEEVAYDVYPLINKGLCEGLGVIGELSTEVDTRNFIKQVKNTLSIESLRASGKVPSKIKKVAICSGAGASLISKAKFSGADIFITGDLKYHDGQLAHELGLFVLDAGHYNTEIIMIECLADYLNKIRIKNNLKFDIIKSKSNNDYIQLL